MNTKPDDFADNYSQAWSAPNSDLLRSMFASDGVYIDGGMQKEYRGFEHIAWFYGHMLRFAPDSRIVFSNPIFAGGTFALEWVWSGTANGQLALGSETYAATGRAFAVPGACIGRLNGEAAVSYHRDYYDVLDLLQQIGLKTQVGQGESCPE